MANFLSGIFGRFGSPILLAVFFSAVFITTSWSQSASDSEVREIDKEVPRFKFNEASPLRERGLTREKPLAYSEKFLENLNSAQSVAIVSRRLSFLNDPESKEFFDAFMSISECYGYVLSTHPEIELVIRSQAPQNNASPMFEIFFTNEFKFLLGMLQPDDGRWYEIEFHHGSIKEDEFFWKNLMTGIVQAKVLLLVMLFGAVDTGAIDSRHERFIIEKSKERLSFSVGFAATVDQNILFRRITECNNLQSLFDSFEIGSVNKKAFLDNEVNFTILSDDILIAGFQRRHGNSVFD